MTLYLMLFVDTVLFACLSSLSLLLSVHGCNVLTLRYSKYPNAPVVYNQVVLYVADYFK